MLDFLRKFKPVCEKRPVGRPRKPQAATAISGPNIPKSASSLEFSKVQPPTEEYLEISDDKQQENHESTNSSASNPGSDAAGQDPPKKKAKRGHYHSNSLQLKMSVVAEMCQNPISVVAEKYNIPRSTVLSWETQLRRKNLKCSSTVRGIHLRSGSGRELSYPKEVDDEIYEWILVRRDAHLPVSRNLIQIKAHQLVKAHNPNFMASSGWLQKFMIRHGLSLCSKTSISQKLPAQLEKKLECFLNDVRIVRTQHE